VKRIATSENPDEQTDAHEEDVTEKGEE